jgi:hypothetical protein
MPGKQVELSGSKAFSQTLVHGCFQGADGRAVREACETAADEAKILVKQR